MTDAELKNELKKALPNELAEALVKYFVMMRSDLSTNTLERSAPGKFVETLVQIFQYLDTGCYNKVFKMNEIDDLLRNAENRFPTLVPDLRIVSSRIARAMYALRSKRGIIHKSEIDPNIYDLHFLFYSSQWIMSEIVCSVLSINKDIANNIVQFIQIPQSSLVEDFGDKRTVLIDCVNIKDEFILLLHHYYPQPVAREQIRKDMIRTKPTSLSAAIQRAYTDRLVENYENQGFKLTGKGYQYASDLIKQHCIA